MSINDAGNIMLTKDLLKFNIRNDRVYPKFVNMDDDGALRTATELIEIFRSTVPGVTIHDLDERLADAGCVRHPLHDALVKLLYDRCTQEDEDDAIGVRRWEVLKKAKDLRTAHQVTSLAGFQVELAQAMGCSWQQIAAGLYADLPEHRRLVNFKPIQSEALLNRYNTALVQGLLLKSDRVSVVFKGATTAQKRYFFRQLKFHRLMALIHSNPEGSSLEVTIDGPLGLFDGAQAYGFRLAAFFPRILALPEWSIEAEVAVKQRKVRLKLTSQSGLQPAKAAISDGYVPPEYGEIFARIQDFDPTLQIGSGTDFVHLGNQSYCFPDFTVEHRASGRKFHFELFHRWHQGQIAHRLRAWIANPALNLAFGACSSLKKDAEILKIVGEFEKNGGIFFWFQDLPAPRTISAAVSKML